MEVTLFSNEILAINFAIRMAQVNRNMNNPKWESGVLSRLDLAYQDAIDKELKSIPEDQHTEFLRDHQDLIDLYEQLLTAEKGMQDNLEDIESISQLTFEQWKLNKNK